MATVIGVQPGSARRYGGVAIAFHWTVALLVLANLAIGLLADGPLGALFFLHKPFGLAVLLLSLLRLAWRLGHPAPPLPASVGSAERLLARVVQSGFHALMVMLPLSGWIFTSASARRRPIDFGLFQVPSLPVPQTKALGGPWHEAHEVMGWVMLALVALHVAGALRHHLLLRDGVLLRMVPGADRR